MPRPTAISANYAELGQRIIAAIIDGIIVGVAGLILNGFLLFAGLARFGAFGMGFMSAMPWMWAPWMWLLSFLIPVAYYTYFEGTTGQTIGKKAMNIRVVKPDGRPCDFASALIRSILRVVDSLVIGLVGIVVISVTEKKQRIGDLVANTIVVKA